MKFDATFQMSSLKAVPGVVAAMETMGFDGVWTMETAHDAFLPLALAAEHTSRLEIGTSVALAFTRSPMVLAHLAWDLASASNGRFILGLGTQVKAHVERRFSMTWDQPVARLREVILSLRAIWQSWASGDRLNFRGEFYKFTLMMPFFTPATHAHPDVPIYIAGVNTGLAGLAGELCDGFHVHPYHSVAYLEEVLIPAISTGAENAGRELSDVCLSSALLVATGYDDPSLAQARESLRQEISFYASTPSYRAVMAHHGWGEVADRLSALAARKRWDEMPSLISDDMLATYAIIAPPDELAGRVRQRYTGLLDRVTYYVPFVPGQMDELWQDGVATLHT